MKNFGIGNTCKLEYTLNLTGEEKSLTVDVACNKLLRLERQLSGEGESSMKNLTINDSVNLTGDNCFDINFNGSGIAHVDKELEFEIPIKFDSTNITFRIKPDSETESSLDNFQTLKYLYDELSNCVKNDDLKGLQLTQFINLIPLRSTEHFNINYNSKLALLFAESGIGVYNNLTCHNDIQFFTGEEQNKKLHTVLELYEKVNSLEAQTKGNTIENLTVKNKLIFDEPIPEQPEKLIITTHV